ncbi:MAG: SWIM zinc finger family protein, partial [Mesorhizobium sp.]
ELDQWIADQLRLGLAGFVDACSERCRRIAARLVDLKATALAGRIDELPARLMALRSEERPDAAIRELGKLVLLAKAWRAAPEDGELKRLVSTSETRDQ